MLAALLLLPGWTFGWHDRKDDEEDAGRWYKYEDCKYYPDEINDGDSFHVRTRSREFVFRLYFVDTPETTVSFPGRVAEQAAYWGIHESAVPVLGKMASDLTKELLANGFTAYSRKEDGKGSGKGKRYLAMVELEDRYLCEILVSRGLARAYGTVTDLPDKKTPGRRFMAHLKRLEDKARDDRQGAWSLQWARRSLNGPPLQGLDIRLPRELEIYSMDADPQRAGFLPAGTRIQVVKTETPVYIHLRYGDAPDEREARCKLTALDAQFK